MQKIKKNSGIDSFQVDGGKNFNKEFYTKSSDGATFIDNSKLLIQAVKQGSDALVVKLLNAGVPSYVSDQLGCNPLFYAARYNHISILKILLDAGALINVVTKMGRTALQISSYHGHTECVEVLLKHKAIVNQMDNLGMTALHWACENGHYDSVKLLLKSGANVSLVSKFGKTAMDLAMKKNHFQIYDLLRNQVDTLNKSPEFLLTEDLLDQTDKGHRPFTAVFIPGKNSSFSNQNTLVTGPITLSESKNDIDQRKLAFKANLKKDDTIKLFEQHGIKLLPVDQSTIIASALKRGQTAVLTEAGKLALKKTEPNIIRKIASMSNNNLNTQPPTKKKRVDDDNEDDSTSKPVPTKIDSVDRSSLNKTKIIKIDAKQLVNLTTNKKLIISKPRQICTSPVSEMITQTENMNPNLTSKSSSVDTSDPAIKEFENQLRKKNNLLRDMKKQLDLSLQLAKHYKAQYEMKDREASLYKIQLANLSKLLMNSENKTSKMQSR